MASDLNRACSAAPAQLLLNHAAVIIWRHILTFDEEVTHFWGRKPSVSCGLFFANRYAALCLAIYNTFYSVLPQNITYTVSVFAIFFFLTPVVLNLRCP